MPTKKGRPLMQDAEKKRNRLEIRLHDEELADIEEVANYYGISRTGAIIKGINKLKEEIKEK